MFQIIDASPESLKKLSDYMNQLYRMSYDQDGNALRKGSITADKIDVTSLFVGTGGIKIDPSATITWNQVTGKPNNITPEQLNTTLSNYLNSGNFSTYITKDWIYTLGLAVGSEILMGENATIAWNNVTSKPTNFVTTSGLAVTLQDYVTTSELPSGYTDADVANYLSANKINTYIGPTGLYTGTIAANKITAGNLTFGSGYSISFDGSATWKLKISENSIDSTGTSTRLWLNWASGAEVHIGDGSSGGHGALYAGNIYSNGTLIQPSGGTVTVTAKWA